ncbi:uncharacterized protein PITG_05131 [Phytophthora infestans T30-4]|uniref:Uncharacterized protein n=1 Tax=Phytophthora infestans (strain T30-4) TaxID=403677 RepID=D0N3M2_PHYIT|nr:uncharacterized protein PITG_05131 [Phytophthora infestans T30-4]EEY68976.1 conserved hypothetical protein [Phytophthora infestans T30-4]|eukprot:XP_002998830.1 conserved hypothetical protein [Phytophthora infestans T30-4]
MKVFDDIAIHCRLEQSFGLKKPGTAMRTRFTNLVNQYKADQCQSMRKSGTTEEYAEREVLLQNIVTLMNDWEDKEAQRKEEQTAKQRGIERSGELLPTDAATSSGRKNKITKRELDVVSNGITSALLEASEDEKAKYQYKMQRLQFEREQEDQKRVHDAAEAEKRRAHELQLEDRRLQSDAARDKRMQEFILKVLEQQKQ